MVDVRTTRVVGGAGEEIAAEDVAFVDGDSVVESGVLVCDVDMIF